MRTLEQVALGLEARLETIQGLRPSEFVPSKITPPAAIVALAEVPNYRVALSGVKFDVNMTVTILVSAAFDRVGQMNLLAYADRVGEKSVFAAVEADRTLGGAADDCQVTGFRPLGLEEVGLLQYYGGVFSLRVMA
jgi:hypothetical protein